MVEEQERKRVVAHRECEREQAGPYKGKIRLVRRIPTRACECTAVRGCTESLPAMRARQSAKGRGTSLFGGR